jgi:uncharacterized protein YjbJ (UPF0337 family)
VRAWGALACGSSGSAPEIFFPVISFLPVDPVVFTKTVAYMNASARIGGDFAVACLLLFPESRPRGGKLTGDKDMNWDRVEGSWKQFQGKFREQWGRFREDELEIVAGKRLQAAGRLQEHYGVSKDEARLALAEFEHRQRDWSTRL